MQNNTNIVNTNSSVDINKLVMEVFKNEFPGAPESEVMELIQDIGQTIMIESMAKMVEEVEKREDKSKDESYAEEIRQILSKDGVTTPEDVKRISEICLMPHININLEEIYKIVAIDVVKDVLGK